MAYNYLNVPFTIIKEIDKKSSDENKQYQWTMSNDKTKLSIKVSNINLKQTPHETLDILLDICRATYTESHYGFSSQEITFNSTITESWETMYCHCYDLKLQFSNYLHEFNQNYNYEILCKLENTVSRKRKQESQCLFYFMEPRLEKSMSFKQQFFLLKDDLLEKSKLNLCFYIRRLCDDINATVDDEKTNGIMNILRNTGYDIVLDCKGGEVRTHRAILSQNSDVFQAMFSAEMKESQNGIVSMLDFESRVVKKMLDYLYTGKLGDLGDMTQSLFKLAHCYQMHNLCRSCEDYYIFNIQVDNDSIVDILELAETYELEKLKEYTLNFANRHEKELIKLASYREYLIQTVNLENAVSRLLLAEKFHVEDVKVKIFYFIKENYQQMIKNPHFLDLFESHGRLMKELYVQMVTLSLTSISFD